MLMVPWILLPKPVILAMTHRSDGATSGPHTPFDDEELGAGRQDKIDQRAHEEFDLSEVMIHQVIETIEYVLGTVSHTASYLRLWALSLAHQQLALVFFQKTIMVGLTMSFPANGV